MAALARLRTWARHAFSALIILGLIVYLWNNVGDIRAGIRISVGQIALLTTLILATWVLNSLPMLVIARLMHKRIGFWENLSVMLAGGLVNYLPMRLGTVMRMQFFNKVHGVDYATFIGVMGVRTLLLVALTGMLGCVGLAGLAVGGSEIPTTLSMLFVTLAIIPTISILITFQTLGDQDAYWLQILRKLGHGHSVLRGNPGSYAVLALITIAQFSVLSMRLFIAFQAFGLHLSWWVLLLLGPTVTLVTFLSITPGSLGVREWIIGGLSGIAGLEFQYGIFAGTLDRAVVMALTFIVGPGCLYYTLRKIQAGNDGDPSRVNARAALPVEENS